MKISSFIQNLKPYVPGRSIEEVRREYGLKEIIKLASNENAIGPNPRVVEALQKALREIHRYPDSSYLHPKQTVADKFQLNPKNICFGNGSDELIDLLVRIFCEPNQDSILVPQSSFVAYKVRGHVNRVEVQEVPLTTDYQIDIARMAETLNDKHRIVFLPNPNNPTGRYLSKKELEPLIQKIRGRGDVLLVLDEAYTEFIRAKDYPDSLKLLKEMKNLVVLRTLSKAYGMAGLRVGFMLADPFICDLVERVRLPFNSNVLASAAIDVALNDQEFIKKSQETVWSGLDYFVQELKKMHLNFCPSQGNFIFFDTTRDSSLVFDELLKKGVILRPVKNYGFMTHMRMTVGTLPENEKAIQSLKQVLG